MPGLTGKDVARHRERRSQAIFTGSFRRTGAEDRPESPPCGAPACRNYRPRAARATELYRRRPASSRVRCVLLAFVAAAGWHQCNASRGPVPSMGMHIIHARRENSGEHGRARAQAALLCSTSCEDTEGFRAFTAARRRKLRTLARAAIMYFLHGPGLDTARGEGLGPGGRSPPAGKHASGSPGDCSRSAAPSCPRSSYSARCSTCRTHRPGSPCRNSPGVRTVANLPFCSLLPDAPSILISSVA